MKSVFRILLYVALLVAAATCFDRFSSSYKKISAVGPAELTAIAPDPAATNDTSLADAAPANAVPTASADPAATNATPLTGNSTTTNVAATPPGATDGKAKPPVLPSPSRPAAGQRSSSFTWLGLFVLTLLALAGLVGLDVSRYLGDRSERSVMASDFVIRKDPDYEAAEEEWTKGNHLDAINLMRGYLQRNPNEQHAAIRIAEIYEKDLNNHLAAALELEEVLNRRLPREKWGWTAIHLANIYSGKLKQPTKALGVLDRIVKEYPDTGAAKKARQRLGLTEPVEGEEISEPETEAPSAQPPPSEPPSNLPKGFRTKK